MINKNDIISYPLIRALIEKAYSVQTGINHRIDGLLDKHPKTTDCIGRCIHGVKSLLPNFK